MKIYSMTAFGQAKCHLTAGEVSIEIKSVNNRYLDINCRFPESFKEMESACRDKIRASIARGKVDCSLKYQGNANAGLSVNTSRVAQIMQAVNTLSVQVDRELSAFELLSFDGVLQSQTIDIPFSSIEKCLAEAIDKFNAARAEEGALLASVLLQKLSVLETILITHIIPLSQTLVEGQRKKLIEKIARLGVEADPYRLEQEVVLAAQRIDIDEEIDRLASHIAQMKSLLKGGDAVGRRLDFLMQEFNREVNTIASKSAEVSIVKEAVEMKVLIEQMREQIQNIE